MKKQKKLHILWAATSVALLATIATAATLWAEDRIREANVKEAQEIQINLHQVNTQIRSQIDDLKMQAQVNSNEWLLQQAVIDENTVQTAFRVKKLWADPHIQRLVNYAYELWGRDFVLTLEAENWNWTSNRVHNKPYWRNWRKYNDHGLCGISDYYHPQVVSHPQFTDPYWQIRKCHELYEGWTRFYWYDVRGRVAWNFNF